MLKQFFREKGKDKDQKQIKTERERAHSMFSHFPRLRKL